MKFIVLRSHFLYYFRQCLLKVCPMSDGKKSNKFSWKNNLTITERTQLWNTLPLIPFSFSKFTIIWEIFVRMMYVFNFIQISLKEVWNPCSTLRIEFCKSCDIQLKLMLYEMKILLIIEFILVMWSCVYLHYVCENTEHLASSSLWQFHQLPVMYISSQAA